MTELEQLVIERTNIILQKLTETFEGKSKTDLALGYLRYEALRKLTPRQFSELYMRNLKGENFDQMINELIVKEN